MRTWPLGLPKARRRSCSEAGADLSKGIQPQALENVLVLTRRVVRAMPNTELSCERFTTKWQGAKRAAKVQFLS